MKKFVGYGTLWFLGLLVGVGLAAGDDPVTDVLEPTGTTELAAFSPVNEAPATTAAPAPAPAPTTTEARPLTRLEVMGSWDGGVIALSTIEFVHDSMVEIAAANELGKSETLEPCFAMWAGLNERYDSFLDAVVELGRAMNANGHDGHEAGEVLSQWFDSAAAFADRCSDGIMDSVTLELVIDLTDKADALNAWLDANEPKTVDKDTV